ncbi:MAG: IS4 family transposase [Polyangiaceae bacterium]|nr:IS4 family transposase [Polyangiaceae bacterium]
MGRRSEAEIWSEEQFGQVELGDARRTARLVRMGTRAAENPSGKLSEVFTCAKELDAAYDFVERAQTSLEALDRGIGRATARQCIGPSRIRVAVDGSSTHLTDETGNKGFGRIGADGRGAKGLKVMTALAVDSDGMPLGLLGQTWWARPVALKRSRKQKTGERRKKRPSEKETRYWLETLERAAERLEEVGARGWFPLDREGDAWPTLLALSQSGHVFTVRSAWDRVVQTTGRDKQYFRRWVAASPSVGSYELDVPGHGGRTARRAHMVLRATQATLRLRDKRTGRIHPLTVHAVWVHEQGTTPVGEKPLDWMLLTNAPIESFEAACEVVRGYAMRWRIEDFPRVADGLDEEPSVARDSRASGQPGGARLDELLRPVLPVEVHPSLAAHQRGSCKVGETEV